MSSQRQSLCDPSNPKDLMNMTLNSGEYVPLVATPGADAHLPVELILGSSSDDVPDIIC